MEIADRISVSYGLCPDQGVPHQLLLDEVGLAEMLHQVEATLPLRHPADRAFRIGDGALRHAHIIGKQQMILQYMDPDMG